MNVILLLVILVGGAFLFKKLNTNYNELSSGGSFVKLLGKSFSLRQSVGLAYIIMGALFLWGFFISSHYGAFLVAIGHFIFGYRFVTLKQKNRIYPSALAVFFLLVAIFNVIEKLHYGDLGDILFIGTLIIFNSFIIYVLWFSKEKEIVLVKEVNLEGVVADSVENIEKSIVPANKRPLSVSIISWILIVSGAYSIMMNVIALIIPATRDAMIEIMVQAPSIVSIPVRLLIMFVILIVMFLCGLLMLKGRNFGRMLYLISGAIFMVYGFVVNSSFNNMTSFALMIASAIVFLINLFFLFRLKANEYFKAS